MRVGMQSLECVQWRVGSGFDTFDTVEGPSEKNVNAARMTLWVGHADRRAGGWGVSRRAGERGLASEWGQAGKKHMGTP